MRRLKVSQFWPAFALFSLGCSANADVVAVGDQRQPQDTDPGFQGVDQLESCPLGRYAGLFNGGFSGDIVFTLRPTQQFEFHVITDSELTGKTSDGVQFDAKVIGNGHCMEGGFTARLEGTFVLGDTAIEFDGPITGDYLGRGNFAGTWVSGIPDTETELGRGDWVALYKGPE